jgi:chromosome partitioning protein
MVRESRTFLDKYGIPVWSGQISHRADTALALAADAGEPNAASLVAAEITRLWTAIELSVDAVNAAYAWAKAAQDQAA